MLIPLKMGLIGANGDELPLKLDGNGAAGDGLLEVTDREQVFEFRDIPSPPTPSLLRGFSAPVRLTISLDPDQIEFLMMHDQDAFNRWQAAQTYATNSHDRRARREGDDARVTGKEAITPRPGARPNRRRCFARRPPTAPSSSSCRASPTSRASLPARRYRCRTQGARNACAETIAGEIGAEPRRALRRDRAHWPLFARPGEHGRAGAPRRGPRSPRRDR